MLFLALLATFVAAQKKENKQCLSSALGVALQKGFEACDMQSQMMLLEAQLVACGAGKGFSVVVKHRDMYYPYSGVDKSKSMDDMMALSKKFFGAEDQDYFLSFKAPTTMIPNADSKVFEVFNDADLEAAIDFARAYEFPLILMYNLIHDYRDAQIHQVVGDAGVIADDTDTGIPKGRTFKFKKLKDDTDMKLTYVDMGRVSGGNGMACNWEIQINGKSCESGIISGSLHTNAGDDDHLPMYISGTCTKGLAAGEHTMSIYVTRSSTASNCYTGWQMEAIRDEFKDQHFLMEAEELFTGYQNIQMVAGYKANSVDVGWVTDSRMLTFDKMDEDSYVRISWVDNFRRANSGWCRFELRVDDGHCPGTGIAAHFHGHNPDNQHMPKQLVGYCKKPKGEHKIRIYVNRASADCHLGWGTKGGVDNYYIEVREMGITGERITWYQYYNRADGRDSGYVNYRNLDFVKLDDHTEMRFMWNDDARVHGSARRCKWEVRVDDKPCETGKIAFSMHTTGNDNDHQRNTLLGYCGGIKKGKHQMRIYVTSNQGHNNHDCYTGGYWGTPNNYVVEAEESDPTRI